MQGWRHLLDNRFHEVGDEATRVPDAKPTSALRRSEVDDSGRSRKVLYSVAATNICDDSDLGRSLFRWAFPVWLDWSRQDLGDWSLEKLKSVYDALGESALMPADDAGTAERVRVLEFEYHGLWPHDRTLRATLAFLEGHLYRCYWQGAFGSAPGDRAAPAGSGHLPALARAGARDDVWCGAFGVKMWSNLVCAHEPHIVKAFDAMAR